MLCFRRCRGLFFASCVASVCGWLAAAEPPDAKPMIREIKAADGRVVAVEASPLAADALAKRCKQSDANEALARVLSVSVDDGTTGKTAIVGSYTVVEQSLRFAPRFPFRAGQAYRAALRPSELGSIPAAPGGDVIFRFRAPAEASSPPTEVTAIFPSAEVIPENQLRFYIHFSAPMARGAAYENVRLLDGRNQPVDLPCLEIGQELWDPRQQRLTLLIDPGRIKRGVKPREDAGPVLRAGEEFTLVANSSWRDAQDRPLRSAAAKRFRVGPPIEEAIDPTQWKIVVPGVASRQPVAVEFPRPLDHALLQRLLTVRSADGAKIDGEVALSQEERRWELRPTHGWSPGRFEIVVDGALEDLAGNRIGRAFEVDEGGPGAEPVQPDAVHLGFEIRAAQ